MTDVPSPGFVILWIEDELRGIEAGVDLLKGLLREKVRKEILVEEAPTVEEAEKRFTARRDSPPDLVLLDLMLPRNQQWLDAKPRRMDMNAGFFLWHRLRMQKEWGEKIAEVPILVVTARGNPEFRPAMLEDERLRWLGKPVGPSELADSIVDLLGAVAAKTATSEGQPP